ncbi:MAG: glycerophosphodiester phosphodiesterase family protein [Lachnospira sp.]
MDKKIRFGIVGTGRIAHRMYAACAYFEEYIEVRVYNPNQESAQSFADECGINAENVYSDIDQFAENIDVAYIATPHETHYEYSKRFLCADKHVLCEKPLTFSGKEALELFVIAKQHRKILMEAVKTAYSPGFNGILSLVKDGAIGDVADVEACFTRLNNSSVREIWDEDNGGSFVEFGTYTLLPIVKLLGIESKETYVWSLPAVTGVDSYSKLVIAYDKACATAKTGLGVKSEGQLVISGSNGYILVPSPWWLTRHVEVHHEDSNRVEIYDFPWEGSGLQYELEVFLNRVLAIEASAERHAEDSDYEEKMSVAWDFLENDGGVTPQESVWFADQMELFRVNMGPSLKSEKKVQVDLKPKVWAHRGCCMKYPENTLEAFEAAAKLTGITGIELDIQLTKDGEIVVIHDEKIDRTTNGKGFVKDYTLEELKAFSITGSGCENVYHTDWENKGTLSIPTMKEVFELLKPYCISNGLLINIELKNSVIRYEGMEEKILELVEKNGLKGFVVYSSFNHESMGLMKKLEPSVKTGILAVNIQDCLKGAVKYNADALHPSVAGLLVNKLPAQDKAYEGFEIRAWGGDEPFYGQKKKLNERHMEKYAALGVTDIITNVPEMYL